MRTFTVEQIKECEYVKRIWDEPYGVILKVLTGVYGPETKLVVVRMRHVFDLIKDCDPIEDARDVPSTLTAWMNQQGIASIYSLKQAVKTLSPKQKSGVIQEIFNGGGWPDAKSHWHPALLQIFIDWIIRLLTEFNSIDGRISKRGQEMINAARKIENLGPVRRF